MDLTIVCTLKGVRVADELMWLVPDQWRTFVRANLGRFPSTLTGGGNGSNCDRDLELDIFIGRYRCFIALNIETLKP